MPSVIISKNSHFHKIVPVYENAYIGRGPGNDVILDEVGISRKHACIEKYEHGYFLVDAGSTNGTFVEGKRVVRHPLTNGSSFRIHDYVFTFVKEVYSTSAVAKRFSPQTKLGTPSKEEVESTRLIKIIGPQHGLAQKLSGLLKLVADLQGLSTESDGRALVLDTLIEITGAKRGILARSPKKGGMVITHMRGFSPHHDPPETVRNTIKKVMEQGAWVYCLDAKGLATEGAAQGDIESMMCIPLADDHRTVGCLYLDIPEPHGMFSESDRDLLEAAADHIVESFLDEKTFTSILSRDVQRFSGELASQGIIARSPKTLKVLQDARNIAQYNVPVLIFGETGTGKEVIARYIHDNSGRSGRFIACNCSAIAESMFESELFGHEQGAFTGATAKKPGLLELAGKGTLFLDEIGDMPLKQQSKLLRVIQEQELWRVGGREAVKIDVRVISATHKDIKNKRKKLKFRDDLYYRLANVEITAPSLKERPEDIGPLAHLILQEINEQHPDGKALIALSPKAVRLLQAYEWPGNIRELRNTLFQVAYRCEGGIIKRHHLKDFLDVFEDSPEQASGPIPPLADVERVHIIKAMRQTNWNKSAAAKVLQIDRNRLSRRLKKLRIELPPK
jgi:transcriptional regulator with GAF, ATPase, and Fis domain